MHKLRRHFLRLLVVLLVSCLSFMMIPLQGVVFADESADALALLEPVAPAARVLFTFDDGWKGQIDYAWPILSAAGFTATTYINSDSIQGTQEQYMREADLDFLYTNGWDIGNHTSTHEGTTAIDPATLAVVTEEYLENQNWIIDHIGDRGAYHIAYPSGSYVPEYFPILRGIGALTARTIDQNVDPTTMITDPDDYYYTLPIKSLSSEPPIPPATETSVDSHNKANSKSNR